MPGATTTYVNWIFTLNNPPADFNPTRWPNHRYSCYQFEIAPTTGTRHAQGYVIFDKRVGLRAVRALTNPPAHWEPRRGTHEQAVAYCTKEETREPGTEPFIAGDPPKPGKRTDLHDLSDAIHAGSSLSEMCRDHTPAMIKFHKGVQYVKMMTSPKRHWDMNVIVLYGPTGFGKSRLAYELAPDAYRVPLAADKNTLWFDGYSGEEDVIIEEFEGYRCTYSFLKEFLDRYPVLVPTKGGHANFSAKRVILTSNTPPEQWYKWNEKRQYAPLERRFTSVLEFTADKQYTLHKGPDPVQTLPYTSPPTSPTDEILDDFITPPDLRATSDAIPNTQDDPIEDISDTEFRTGVSDKDIIHCNDCGARYTSEEDTPGCPFCTDRKKHRKRKEKAPPKKKKKLFH